MEYIGRIKNIENERSGVSQSTGNPWRALSFVFEFFTPENQRFPDSVVLDTFSDTIIDQLKNEKLFQIMNAKTCVKIEFYHKTRTYEGRTYNDIRINKFEFLPQLAGLKPVEGNTPQTTENAAETKNGGKDGTVQPTTQAATGESSNDDDNLPF